MTWIELWKTVIKRSPQIWHLPSKRCKLNATLLLSLNSAEKEKWHKTLFSFRNYARAKLSNQHYQHFGFKPELLSGELKKKKDKSLWIASLIYFIFEWPLADGVMCSAPLRHPHSWEIWLFKGWKRTSSPLNSSQPVYMLCLVLGAYKPFCTRHYL